MRVSLPVRPLFIFALLAGWLGLAVMAPGRDSVDARKPHHDWNWLTEADEDRILSSIPPKPERGSAVDREDLQIVLKVQHDRTPQEIAEARNDEQFRLEIITQGLVPADFNPDHFPRTFDLLTRAREDESVSNSTLKKRYRRLRPYQEHPEVHALFPVEQYSYPSGHASGSMVLADVLGELFPEKKQLLHARAEAVGQSRVVAGVHYPSDVKEGQVLAHALVAALLANPAFQKDLAAAKEEIASATKPVSAG